ncbi:hypothetical protein LJR225_002601 [Phenylobacterium sp. LjRoot225]|uniref:hypothetical protein n=1 Tax=Phenylobacterium sp. LjRoot225 TaxID=3342285 RepID=UPI003ECD3154
MPFTETPRLVVQIGVFAAREGWLLTHPDVQGRFADRDEAMAAARRLAHLESWRGRDVNMLVQEPLSAEVASFDPR